MKGPCMRASLRGAGLAFAVLLIALLAGCAPLIADYSLEAYKSATTLKAETAALIDKSEEAYAAHKTDVDILTTKINAAYEFSAGIPANEISARQWDVLRGDALYGGFVKLWAAQGTTGAAYRAEKKRQLSEAYNQIICLEVNKQSATSCGALAAMGDAK
jgi:hypothetical protein